MKAPPQSTKDSLTARLNDHARTRWPELAGVDDAHQQLLSWNLHLAARRTVGLLPSDVVFTEPPAAR